MAVKLRDERGRTPLHAAALHDGSDAVVELLESMADVDAQDGDGAAPLHLAAAPAPPPPGAEREDAPSGGPQRRQEEKDQRARAGKRCLPARVRERKNGYTQSHCM